MKTAAVALLALLTLSQVADLQAQASFTFFTIAGHPLSGSSDGAASAAGFNNPQGIAVAPTGAVYIADTNNHTVRRIGTDGTVVTVAGRPGRSGVANGAGSNARFTSPTAIAVDAVGVVYVSDSSALRRIAVDGAVSTLTSLSQGGNIGAIRGVAADTSENVFVATDYNVWRIPTSTGVPVLLAGPGLSNTAGYVDGTGSAVRFNRLGALTIDGAGNLFVTDSINQRVRKVTSAGVVSTVAIVPAAADNSAGAYGIAINTAGTLFVANTVSHNIYRYTQDGELTFLAGSSVAGAGDATGSSASFSSPRGLALSGTGVLYVADTGNSTIRAITTSAVVTTVAGRAGGAGKLDRVGAAARFNSPRALAFGPDGTLYVADYNNCTIRAIAPSGAVSTFAGSEAASQSAACGSTNGTGTAAKFSLPAGVAVDSTGNVFVADTGNSVIRKITPAGVVTTFAGMIGTSGATDGTGSAARFFVPRGMAFDSGGTLYVADTGNHTIRAITPEGVVTTVAGLGGQSGSTNGTGSDARFNEPTAVAVDSSGTIYVADSRGHSIRKIAAGGVVTRLAGGNSGNAFADGTGEQAGFSYPIGVAVDGEGNLYVADTNNNALRRVTSAGVVATVSFRDESSDLPTAVVGHRDGVAANARFFAPHALTVDSAGNLFVADTGNHVIRAGLVSATAPAITAQPASTIVNAGAMATFTVLATGNLPPAMQWQISTDAGTSWNSLAETSPYSGVTTNTLTITGTPSTLHNARFRAVATNQSGTATSNSATLTVNYMSATPTTLRFGASKAGSSGAITAVTPAQAVTVLFNGATSTWTASSNQTWATVASGTGNGNGRFTVSIANPGNIIGGATSLSATITITPGSGSLNTVTVPVTLAVDQTGTSTQPPIGQMDTPSQNATGVVGAIAVTGWVIDDVGIASVKLYRNCLVTEPQANCQSGIVDGASVVYVGDGSVVAGARPDVEAGFPTYAATNTAGWGIQVLTNMLPRTTGTFAPNGGVGPLTLYAVATDIEGNRTLLSRAYTDTVRTPTSITMDNDNIAKPFGTIDTPAEGSTVSGSLANFGWAITPDSNTSADGTDILIPTNGTTMFVFIDGVPVSPVAYNQCRGNVGNPVPAGVYCNDDISNILGSPTPQAALTARTANVTRYRNLDAQRAAIGAYIINTSGMTSGLHSLAWSVTDSANRTEGIGSRYFYVLNSGDEAVGTDVVAARALQSRGAVSDLAGMPLVMDAVLGRTGFDLGTRYQAIDADDDGVRRVRIDETGRLELLLGRADRGYLAVNGTLRDLPPGSHLDPATGIFTWAPGPGYRGTYRLMFLNGGEQLLVDVTIQTPDATPSGQSEIRMHLDGVTPLAGTVRGEGPALSERLVRVEGWAFDPRPFTGSGIDAVHVWARRLDAPNSGAVFLGAAALGGHRPDVAAAFGDPGSRAGYSLTATLPPGLYEVTVYAWNRRTARWEDARTVVVRVTR